MTLPISAIAPEGLAQQAASATRFGSWLNTGATALETISNTTAMGYQSRVTANNAALAEQDARSATAAGEQEAEVSRLRTGELVGAQKTAQAANNIDVNSGSPVAVREATQSMGDLDALTIRYNAAKQAYSDRVQSASYRAQSGLMRFGALTSAVGGGAKTYASYISGSNALTNQRLLFGQTGVPNE